MGVARIFQRGGHTLSNRGYSRFRNLNIVGCLSKKRLTKGGVTQDPPWLRPCKSDFVCVKIEVGFCEHLSLSFREFVCFSNIKTISVIGVYGIYANCQRH